MRESGETKNNENWAASEGSPRTALTSAPSTILREGKQSHALSVSALRVCFPIPPSHRYRLPSRDQVSDLAVAFLFLIHGRDR